MRVRQTVVVPAVAAVVAVRSVSMTVASSLHCHHRRRKCTHHVLGSTGSGGFGVRGSGISVRGTGELSCSRHVLCDRQRRLHAHPQAVVAVAAVLAMVVVG